MLCRLFSVWLGLWGMACMAALAQTQAADPPRLLMLQQAQQWVASGMGRAPSQVNFAPLDERVQVKTCEKPLVFDWPFASRESLRVRCLVQPGAWQLYLRLVEAPSVRAFGADTVSEPAKRKVVVAKRFLSRATVLTPDMVELAEVTVGPSLIGPLDQVTLVQFAELLRDVPAGVPIQAHDLRRAVLVRQGQMAVLSVGKGQGFEIAVRVEALQDGRMGEQVRLKNPESGRSLSGVVTGPNALKGL